MLDVNVIRSEPEKIRTMLLNRNKDPSILDLFLDADSEWRVLTDENNNLRKERNTVSAEISKLPKGPGKDAKIASMREVGDRIKANDERMAELETVRNDCVLNIPNITRAFLSVRTAPKTWLSTNTAKKGISISNPKNTG